MDFEYLIVIGLIVDFDVMHDPRLRVPEDQWDFGRFSLRLFGCSAKLCKKEGALYRDLVRLRGLGSILSSPLPA